MAADDQTEPFALPLSSIDAGPSPGNVVPLPPVVGEWLAARLTNTSSDVRVIASAVGNRWFFRVEAGASASCIEVAARAELAPAELAAMVRRWARGVGLASRSDGNQGADARITITPPAATRS